MALLLWWIRGPATAARFPSRLPLAVRGWPGRQASGAPPPDDSVVRIPHAWKLRLERSASKRRERRGSPEREVGASFGEKLLLRTRRQELSQAARHTVGRLDRPRLVSDGWKHRLSQGDYFQLERTRNEPAREAADGDAPSTFLELGLEPRMVAPLQEVLGISRPSPVQQRTIPALLKGGHALCGAETGSGKTLAYLLPLFQRLLQAPKLPEKDFYATSPRSLVVVPSRELAGQVRRVAALLADPLDLRVKEIGGGRGMAVIRRRIHQGPTDLLIATPGALSKVLKRRMLSLEKLLFLVLDEVDTLLDASFIDLVKDIIQHAFLKDVVQQAFLDPKFEDRDEAWDPKAQLVAMGATLPKGLSQMLNESADLSNFTVLTGSSLHCLQPHVEQRFIRLKGCNKVAEVLQLLKERGSSSGAVIIFCNTASTVNWLSYILDDHNIKHLRLQGEIAADVRADIFNAFRRGESDILLCTDIASRGLDTIHVELIINYDFPLTLPDYLHRVGRVGRIGSKFLGTAVSFVTHRWDVDLVRKIETAARKRTALPGLDIVVKEALHKKKKT
ncbi:probable ATP-dependent RNA helicase DDX28 [Thamnophis elegans]|uniref:probable ATP-dependent RNA helicase DDX28 n=1 Tax=Thamnophis elegans TaxID=35005 RepID=UPI0013789190|nr:probable ATP-dependent RNA helicase DDX28 [Thamnophis elegans]